MAGGGKTPPNVPLIERVMRRVEKREDGCWIWTGGTYGGGYGRTRLCFQGTKRSVSTHVVVYEHARGPVPEGLELDHICRVLLCCNPDHLEAVTHAENMRRILPEAKAAASRNLALARSLRWPNRVTP